MTTVPASTDLDFMTEVVALAEHLKPGAVVLNLITAALFVIDQRPNPFVVERGAVDALRVMAKTLSELADELERLCPKH